MYVGVNYAHRCHAAGTFADFTKSAADFTELAAENMKIRSCESFYLSLIHI